MNNPTTVISDIQPASATRFRIRRFAGTEPLRTPPRARPQRQADPPGPGGYWRLQPPLTRAARIRLVGEAEFWGLTEAVCTGVTDTMAAPPLVTEEERRADAEWRAGLTPPLGYAPPRWRLQRPLLRVAAGMRTVADSDYTAIERAMWAGVKRGLGIHGPDEDGLRRRPA